jgi:hypothetical protein
MGALIQETGKRYEYYVRALRGQFGGDLASMIFECNKEVFWARKNQTPWFQSIAKNNIQTGRFYLINYYYNGNKVFCPIFAIDYRVSTHNKHNLYAINLDYLPFDYKMLYFNTLYNNAIDIFESNADENNVMNEKRIPVNFETIYRTLEKNGGYNFAITAFDINKILEIYIVSTNLMYLITNVHMRPVNVTLMKELSQQYDEGLEPKIRLDKLLSEMDDMTESYDNDVKDYYKKLRSLENNYKLFDD